MRIFLSFRYTGETYESLVHFFRPVCTALETQGHEVFCSLWREESYKQRGLGVQEMLQDAFSELSKSDVLLAVVRTNERSEGMLMEVGYALANKIPVYVLTAQGTKTFISDVAEKSLPYSDQVNLLHTLTALLENI
jgi:nucleoside 2-deoxyribosyltransferase